MSNIKNKFIKLLISLLKRNVILKPKRFFICDLDFNLENEKKFNKEDLFKGLLDIKNDMFINFIIQNNGSNIELYVDLEDNESYWDINNIEKTIITFINLLLEDYEFQLEQLYKSVISLDDINNQIELYNNQIEVE